MERYQKSEIYIKRKNYIGAFQIGKSKSEDEMLDRYVAQDEWNGGVGIRYADVVGDYKRHGNHGGERRKAGE